MKLEEIREKSIKELNEIVVDCKKQLFDLRFKKFTNKAQNCCKYTLKKNGNAYIMIANEKTKERGKQTWQQEKKIYGF